MCFFSIFHKHLFIERSECFAFVAGSIVGERLEWKIWANKDAMGSSSLHTLYVLP